MARFSEDLWRKACDSIQEQFNISSLLPEQEQATRYFFEKNDVFINLPTGYGKSLIFQCIPIMADVLFSQPRGSNIIVVISPLKSLMEDQVSYLHSVGVPAITLGDDEDPQIIQQVINGCFIVVYGSPECILSSKTWRGIFADPSFQEMLVGVAIDEAHVVVQWGLGAESKVAFRKWYGNLGELKSLLPNGCHLLVLTATATKTTKQKNFNTLQLSIADLKMVEQSPDRPNLFYTLQYLDKNQGLEMQFGKLLQQLKTIGPDTPRTIIYCQTRKHCSILFRMFEVYLGDKLFHGNTQPHNRLVEMYDSGSPTTVKDHIGNKMAEDDSHLRVLICTIAFGMGVNCKKVRRIIHFGPSKSVEMYVQECGRAGRDDLPSTCVLLYNGLLSFLCNDDMKQYLQLEGCRRKWMMIQFGCKEKNSDISLHDCCDFCYNRCDCGSCGEMWNPMLSEDAEEKPEMVIGNIGKARSQLSRVVTLSDKEKLRKELWSFRKQMFQSINVATAVSCPNVLQEFNAYHIEQVVENCTHLFTLEYIFYYVEIWRSCYATGLLQVLMNTFGDIIDLPNPDESDMDTCEYSDWGHVRDDSTLINMFDSHDMEQYDFLMETQESDTSEEISIT